MRDFMTVHRDQALPAIVMGDLNIPADEPEHYGLLMETLFMRDAWTILGTISALARHRSATTTSTRTLMIAQRVTSDSTMCWCAPEWTR